MDSNAAAVRLGAASAEPLFDAHLHIVEPGFALTGNQGYVPEPFTIADYRDRTAGLGITGGAVVAGSFQGLNPAPILAAVARLGPGYVGVVQLPPDTDEARIRRLHSQGIRAVRFNLKRGLAPAPADLLELSLRGHRPAGWHTEL